MEKEKIRNRIKYLFDSQELVERGKETDYVNHLARLPEKIDERIDNFIEETHSIISGLVAGDKGNFIIDLNERWDTFRDESILQFHAETKENAEIIKNAINKYLLPVYRNGDHCEAYNGQIWER